MIHEYNATRYCCEDISKIKNYRKAVKDQVETWQCHHILETKKGLTKKQLIEMRLYWNRPASELVFLTVKEHQRLHRCKKEPWNKGKKGIKHKKGTKHPPRTPEQLERIREAQHRRREREKNDKISS